VVALGLAVHKEIKTNFLLESKYGLNFLGDELTVLTTGELTLAEFGTGLMDLLGLRERPNCSSWELGQTQVLLLSLTMHREGAFAFQVLGSNSSNTLTNCIIRSRLEFTSLRNRDVVGLKRLADLGILESR